MREPNRESPDPDRRAETVDITVLGCTYNRRADLRELLDTALAQETGGAFTYEVLVVDNNSSDGTRQMIEALMAEGRGNLRYLFEGRQGKSFALNAGLSAARGAVYTVTDDDLILPRNYLRQIHQAFREHPEVSFVGGKTLPLWLGEPPAWLTPTHWSPLALCDYGEEAFYVDDDHPVCLLAAAFRRRDVNAAGGYRPELGVSKGRIGGTEDTELPARLRRMGRGGIYLPQIAVYHKVPLNRLTRSYHRQWRLGHGNFYAAMRAPEMERSSVYLLGAPGHLYRQAAADLLAWLWRALRGRADEAFEREIRLRFFAGFFRARSREFRASLWRGRGANRRFRLFSGGAKSAPRREQ